MFNEPDYASLRQCALGINEGNISIRSEYVCIYTKYMHIQNGLLGYLGKKQNQFCGWKSNLFAQKLRGDTSPGCCRGTYDLPTPFPAPACGVSITNTTPQGKQPFSVAEWVVLIPFPHYQALKLLWSKYNKKPNRLLLPSLSTSRLLGTSSITACLARLEGPRHMAHQAVVMTPPQKRKA